MGILDGDNLTDITGAQTLAGAGHADRHNEANTAIEAIRDFLPSKATLTDGDLVKWDASSSRFVRVDSGTYLPAVGGEAGDWISGPFTPSGTIVTTENREYAIPFLIPPGRTIDRIAANISAAAAGSSIRAGVRANDNGAPGDLVAEASTAIDSTLTGERQATISADPGPGWCFVILKPEGGAPTLIRAQNCQFPAALNSAQTDGRRFPYWAASAGAFPTTWGGTRGTVDYNSLSVSVRLA